MMIYLTLFKYLYSFGTHPTKRVSPKIRALCILQLHRMRFVPSDQSLGSEL